MRYTLDQKISDATRKCTQLGVWPSEVSVLDYLIQCCEGRGRGEGLWFLQHVIGMNQILKYLLIFMTCQLFSQLVITIWREICQYCPKQDCSIQEGICFKRLIIFFQLPIILKFIYFFGFTLLEVYTHDVHIFRIDTQLVMLFLCPTFYSFW